MSTADIVSAVDTYNNKMENPTIRDIVELTPSVEKLKEALKSGRLDTEGENLVKSVVSDYDSILTLRIDPAWKIFEQAFINYKAKRNPTSFQAVVAAFESLPVGQYGYVTPYINEFNRIKNSNPRMTFDDVGFRDVKNKYQKALANMTYQLNNGDVASIQDAYNIFNKLTDEIIELSVENNNISAAKGYQSTRDKIYNNVTESLYEFV